MALNSNTLKTAIIENLESNGFVRNTVSQEWLDGLSKSIADAVVEHITSQGQVIIPSGSSAGTYPII